MLNERRSAIDVLVTENIDLVGHIVRSVAARYPRHVDRNDLWNAGALGLVEAANRYDPDSEIPFQRYAAIRIRGAIIDSTRTRDWATRAVRRELREVRMTQEDLERGTGRIASDDQVAAALGITTDELSRRRYHENAATLLHLDQQNGEDGTLGDIIEDQDVVSRPDVRLEQQEMLGTLREAVKGLQGRQAEIIRRYYLEGDLMKDIADDLGITEARVSQIRSEALAAMRTYFSTLYEEITPAPDSMPGKRARTAYVASVSAESSWRDRIEVS